MLYYFSVGGCVLTVASSFYFSENKVDTSFFLNFFDITKLKLINISLLHF
jgi:hypothetical protein